MNHISLLIRGLALLGLLVLFRADAFGVTQELLANGGFEPPYNAVSGTTSGGTISGNYPSGWTENSRNQGKQTNNTYSEETVNTVSGSAFKAIVAADSAGANPAPALYLYQTMNAVPGRPLTATVWMKASANTTATMNFLLTSSPFTSRGSKTCNVTTNWQQFTLTSTTPPAAEIDRMEIRCTSAVTLWLDEASVPVQSSAGGVFVSPAGSDTTGSGTLAAPYQTIAKALANVYPGDTVQLRAGTYRETVMPTQSGQANAPITITNYNGEAATVTGADVIAGPWTAGANGIYTAAVGWDFGIGLNNIFVDGAMVHEAREPNYGGGDVLHPATASLTVTPVGSQSSSTAKVDSTITSTTFSGKPNNFYAGAHLHAGIGQSWAWQGANTIASSTGNAISVTVAAEYGSWWFTGTGNGYVYGLLSLLDADNEWFVQGGTISVRVTGQADPTSHLVEMRHRTYTIDCNNKSYLVFRGLNLRCGDVRMNGSGNTLDHCDASYLTHFLTYSGATQSGGIVLSGTGQTVSNCTIHDTAANGVNASGSGHTITRNLIYNTDYSGTYANGISLSGTGHTVTFNTVHHSGRDLSQPNGSGHTFAYNDLYEPGQMCKDLACIYTFSTNAQGATGGPTRIAYNWCHDHTTGSNLRILLYLDNWHRNFVVDHNVCWNGTGDAGIRLNGPKDGDKIYHNTLYNCDDANTHTFTIAFSDPGNPDPAFWNASGSYSTDLRNNLYLAATPDAQLTNSAVRDFRPKAGAAAIDGATLIPGYNDNFVGAAPDQGAYEAGGAYWVPGVNGWSIDQPGSTSSPASTIGETTATANGTLISAGAAVTTVRLYWGGTVAAAWAHVSTLGAAYTGTYQALAPQLTGLAPATTYWYRYRSTNTNGDTWTDPQSFTTLADTTAPVVTAPGNINVHATSPAGAEVSFAPTATDAVGVTSLISSPASGSTFPPGTTTVTVTAKDAANNTGTASFTVTVTPLTSAESWRYTYFGTPDNAGAAADTADPDGDGQNNFFEYVAGLLPNSPASRFAVRVESVAGQPGRKAIIFSPVVGGRAYTVKGKAHLTDPTWTALGNITTSDNVPLHERTVIDLAAGSAPKFYLVEIELP